MLFRQVRCLYRFSKKKHLNVFQQRIEASVNPIRSELENFKTSYTEMNKKPTYNNLSNFVKVLRLK